MENHPIPQDITGFQFKLVGKMTVRQFVYVGVGVFLAWLIYFVLKLPLFLSLPLAIFFAVGGAALAFLPIDGRPMDVMIRNFIRSVVSPTQYTYEKQGGSAFSPGQTNVSAPVAQAVLRTQPNPALPQQPQPTVEPAPSPAIEQPATPAPASLAPEKKLETEEEQVEKGEVQLEGEIKKAEMGHQPTGELEQKLNEVMRQKEELEKELAELKLKMDNLQASSSPTPIQTPNIAPTAPNLPTEPAAAPTQSHTEPTQDLSNPTPPPASHEPVTAEPMQPATPPTPAPISNALPEEPNLVKGTVKDSRGNPLQNILVEVKDEEDNPVRAFKTNAKGEFASATSLPNGKYTVVLEDPRMVHKFDTSSIEATGGALIPLEITSIDQREELRRELFN